MSVFVLDASVAAAWVFDDETGSGPGLAQDRLKHDDALVPELWHIELRNSLLIGTRRGRVARDKLAAHFAALKRLPIHTDSDPDIDAAFALAERHRLTFYDAVYLELAMRRQVPLATLDEALARAAAGENLELVVGPSTA